MLFAGLPSISYFVWPPLPLATSDFCYSAIGPDQSTGPTLIQFYVNVIMVSMPKILFHRIYILTTRHKTTFYLVLHFHKSCFMLFTGDWFLLMQMAKHIRPTVMYHLMLDLRDKLDKKRASNGDDD